MMGVPIEGPSYIYGSNMSMIYNNLRPESVLRNKFNSIFYNFVREEVAAKECLTNHILVLNNMSDLLKKIIYDQKRRNLVKEVLCDIYDHDWGN